MQGIYVILTVSLNLASGFTACSRSATSVQGHRSHVSAILTLPVGTRMRSQAPDWLAGVAFDTLLGPIPVGWLVPRSSAPSSRRSWGPWSVQSSCGSQAPSWRSPPLASSSSSECSSSTSMTSLAARVRSPTSPISRTCGGPGPRSCSRCMSSGGSSGHPGDARCSRRRPTVGHPRRWVSRCCAQGSWPSWSAPSSAAWPARCTRITWVRCPPAPLFRHHVHGQEARVGGLGSVSARGGAPSSSRSPRSSGARRTRRALCMSARAGVFFSVIIFRPRHHGQRELSIDGLRRRFRPASRLLIRGRLRAGVRRARPVVTGGQSSGWAMVDAGTASTRGPIRVPGRTWARSPHRA